MTPRAIITKPSGDSEVIPSRPSNGILTRSNQTNRNTYNMKNTFVIVTENGVYLGVYIESRLAGSANELSEALKLQCLVTILQEHNVNVHEISFVQAEAVDADILNVIGGFPSRMDMLKGKYEHTVEISNVCAG